MRFNWDFPFGLLPTNGGGGFRDLLPALLICKTFSKSALGFCPAQEVVCRHFVFKCSFSPGGEDTASVVALVLCDSFHFFHPDIAIANLSRPIRSKMV